MGKWYTYQTSLSTENMRPKVQPPYFAYVLAKVLDKGWGEGMMEYGNWGDGTDTEIYAQLSIMLIIGLNF